MEAHELKVRRAVPEDAPCLAAVEVAAWRAAYRGLMPDAYLAGLSEAEKAEEWRKSLLKHGPLARSACWSPSVRLARSDSSGSAPCLGEADGVPSGLVYLVYVLPEYWGTGVGRALMAAAVDDLRDLGVREAVLWVLRENRRARAFYEGLGWRPDGRTATHDYGGTPWRPPISKADRGVADGADDGALEVYLEVGQEAGVRLRGRLAGVESERA